MGRGALSVFAVLCLLVLSDVLGCSGPKPLGDELDGYEEIGFGVLVGVERRVVGVEWLITVDRGDARIVYTVTNLVTKSHRPGHVYTLYKGRDGDGNVVFYLYED